jgi:ABC-type transporter Mla maintaining outer membrane lipid asymmetry ATPase subunit MlaF
MPYISLQNLYKSFDGREVLRGMSIDVERGESLVIVGGSGTGKSVTLKHIIGLLRPDRGRVIIDGEDITTMKEVELNQFRRRFGMAFQEGALFDSMSVFENIAFPLRRHTKMPEKQIRERVMECLEDVHLNGVEKKRPSELSGGMRRRVGFARALAQAGDSAVRRADDWSRPGDQRRRGGADRRDGREARDDHGDDHARHEGRVQDRRPGGDALPRTDHRAGHAR